jgi:beta propeller repeat protein
MKKLILLLITLICMTGLASFAAAADAQRVGTGHDPAIDGTRAVWTDDFGCINYYDINHAQAKVISDTSASKADISGKRIVWHDESTGVPQLVVYDVSTRAKTVLSSDIDSGSIPCVSGFRVVWSAGGNVFLRDMSAHKQRMISVGNSPDISGDIVTYTRDDGDRPQVYYYNLKTGRETMASDGGDLYSAHTNGKKIIWADWNTRMGWIGMCDIKSGKRAAVTSDSSSDENGDEIGCDTGTHISMDASSVVYYKNNGDSLGAAGIYAYDIANKKTKPVFETTEPSTPEVSGKYVIWGPDQAQETGGNGIYLINMNAKPHH